MKLKEVCLIVTAAVMLCIFAQPALAASAISVEPVYIDVWQDDEFTVNITVDPAENEVYGASYTLHFNNALLMATSWTQGEFLTRDGESSNVWIHEIDNILGKVEYAEVRMDTDIGVGGAPGNLTTITFQVIGAEGVSLLNISDLDCELLCSTSGSIPTTVYNGRAGIAQTQSPFVISGYVSYEDGSGCNNPTVNITNLNTSKEWTTETEATSNYYQIMLASCADVIAGETLQFTATSPDGSQSNTTEHTVTQDEVNNGGIFSFNITLASPDLAPYLVIYTISNTTISPDGDGIMDDTEIDVEFSEPVNAAIKIENASGVVKSLYTSSSVTNPDPKTWYGTDGSGAIVADGTYHVNITMNDGVNPLVYNNTETITVSTSIDPDPPVITDIANTTPTDSLVTITWTTDEASDSLVKYGTTSGTYTDNKFNAVMATSHSITLTGLSSDMTYYFVVNSTDASDNSNESEEHNFTTTTAPDYSPSIVIYTISNTTISPNGDGIMDDTEINVEFSETVNATILIENATGIIRTLYTGSYVTDPDPQGWNGTDNDGDIVADGTYYVNITMDDGVNPLVYDNTRSIVVANMSVISIGNASATMTIPITIEDAINVGAVDITITYNASLVNVTNVTGGDMDITMANLEHVHEGWVQIVAFQGENPGLNGRIILANVTFSNNSTNGTSSLNLSITTFKDATNDTNPIPYIVQNGTYTAVLNGDVNGDGVVDIADAMYLAKHVLGKSGFEEIIEEVADVNDDGVIDIADAMYLAKHVLGKSGFEELR